MEEPESFPLDSEDVREQIEQQRALTAQLREKLEQDELQLASKEQQNELLKSKLSLLKSRTKAKKNAAPSDKDDRKVKSTKDNSGSSPKHVESKYVAKKQPGNSASKGKINILREQLEQNRLRFERHGLELNEGTRSMEAMVEQLRHELEERDVTIEQLQIGQGPPVVSASEEKILEPLDVSTQLFNKEQEVRNLTNQVSELQNFILELQENLKEKDCVIEARTQAISLLSEDMSKKWRANVDMLEETRQQMQMMQENFVRIEAGLNAEIDQLNLQLHDNAAKLSETEQNVKVAEAARNELSSKNEELLRELKNSRETPKSSAGLEDAKLKIEELTQALSEANKLTVKLKAEHKAKVKTLNKQIDSLRKESDSSGDLDQLQNHIAELEEEKASQENKILQLQETVSELQNLKIVAEMRVVELEEEQFSSGLVQQEVSDLKLKLEEREKEIGIFKEKLNNFENSSSSNVLVDLQNELDETRSSLNEWQCRYEGLEKQIQEKTDENHSERISSDLGQDWISVNQQPDPETNVSQRDLVEKVKYLEESMREKQILIQELEAVVQSSLQKIDSISSVERDCSKCSSVNKELLDTEAQMKTLEWSINTLKAENENLRLESIALHQASDTKEDTSDLQRVLMETSGTLELKKEECARLEDKLKAQVEKSKKIAVNLRVRTLTCKELEEKVNRCEAMIESNKVEIDQLTQEKQNLIDKWQMEMSEKDTALSGAAEELARKEEVIHNISGELQSSSHRFVELETHANEMQALADQLKCALEERNAIIEALKADNGALKQQIDNEQPSELQAQVNALQTELATEREEKQAAFSKLENFTKQAKLKLAKEKKVRLELIEKQSELESLLAEKTNILSGIQEQHAMELDQFRQEKERFEGMLVEHQMQADNLQQLLEQERSKLQYASESVNPEETIEIAEELQTLQSLESFQNEVESLCSSFSNSSPHEVLPVLEEEKVKTLNELGSSFESLHSQIVERLKSKPDLHGDRKLFAELKNLVTRVVNRTAALENKIKKIVAESNSVIHRRLLEAEENVQLLENSLADARVHLDNKEQERANLEEAVNNLNQERWNLCQQMHDENQKSLNLELKLKETADEMEVLIQTKNSLQEESLEKENSILSLQSQCQTAIVRSDEVQLELLNAQQQNSDLRTNLENLREECEVWRSKCQIAEQDINNSNSSVSELKTCYNESLKRCETLQQQVNDSTQYCGELQLQLQKSSQELGELQHQLAGSMHSYSGLQEELSVKSDAHLQQIASWSNEREQLEQKVYDLTQQLQAAQKQMVQENSQVVLSPSSNNAEEESLRQQLEEKTAELENYQRRLIQLQMGSSESNPPLFTFSSNTEQASDLFQVHEKLTYQQEANPSSILDAFKPAASLFETPTGENELEIKIQSLTEQLETLISEKDVLQTEKGILESNFLSIQEELNASKRVLEATQSTTNDLNLRVSELTSALGASEACVGQQKSVADKLKENLKELKVKLENETYDKENAESALEDQAQSQAEARPDIPQSLDTHVSSLQDSGSGFSRDGKQESFDSQKTDESLMECNITLLESELRGMVMSQLEGSLKQDFKEGKESLFQELSKLTNKLSQLEAEKKAAYSEIKTLQAEIKVLSQSATGEVSSANQTELTVSDALMNEDDSWDWGAESAHLEMQHQQQKSQNQSVPDFSSKELQEQIDALKSENNTLENDKVQLAEDLKTSQIRAAKLTRKLKELKAKYDDISGKSRSTDSPFDSLDQAIEEERMKQMQVLEKELKDFQNELTTVKTERDRLQKQVEVLSSANERMVEAKERQDVEVEMWQKRSRDLTSQVQALEWRIQELEDGKEENTTQATESPQPSQSPEILNAVEIDQLLKENHTWNTNYENLMQEYQKLRAQCLAEGEQRTQIDALVSQQKGMIERLEHEKTYFQDVYDSLKMDYESASAQLALKEENQNKDGQCTQKVEELEIKLATVEKQLQETVNQLEVVSSDNADLQSQCSRFVSERQDLLQRLEHAQSRLEANALEISQLQEQSKSFDENSVSGAFTEIGASQPKPVNEVFIAQESTLQGVSPNSTVVNWGNVFSGSEQPSGDIFDSIASNTTQALEDQLLLKETELQRDKRMIETLKRTMDESEQEWAQLIEYHKNQLEVAKKTICDLQCEVEALKQSASSTVHPGEEKCQELQNLVFFKEKEMESLQLNLAVSEETKRKLEEELQSKNVEFDRLLSEITLKSREVSPQPNITPLSGSTMLPSPAMSIPAVVSVDNNLTNALDEALCMLHERDVRCEELTLELTQLLEERDGLQLRLSNAIRTNEELRERLNHLLSNQSDVMNFSPVPPSQQGHGVSTIRGPVVSNENVGSEGYAVDLQNKLTELRKIGYHHDKSLKDNSEYRHQQQMRLLSPSPTTAILAGTPSDLPITSETVANPLAVTVQNSSDTNPNEADQSTSNESQGSLLGWFWGR